MLLLFYFLYYFYFLKGGRLDVQEIDANAGRWLLLFFSIYILMFLFLLLFISSSYSCNDSSGYLCIWPPPCGRGVAEEVCIAFKWRLHAFRSHYFRLSFFCVEGDRELDVCRGMTECPFRSTSKIHTSSNNNFSRYFLCIILSVNMIQCKSFQVIYVSTVSDNWKSEFLHDALKLFLGSKAWNSVAGSHFSLRPNFCRCISIRSKSLSN